MLTIDKIIENIIAAEGSAYTNNPADSGGPTKFGITQRALAAWRQQPTSADDVKALTMNEAAKIYRDRYYVKPGFDKVLAISPAIGAELTDTGVNMGPTTATVYLQRALNVFNNGGQRFPDLPRDGVIGFATLAALQTFINWRGSSGEVVLLRTLNGLQCAHYVDLAEKRMKDEQFIFGWVLNRVAM